MKCKVLTMEQHAKVEMLDSETIHKLCNAAVEFIYPAHGDEASPSTYKKEPSTVQPPTREEN
eukprot:3124464-Amphidinium_carterae.1